MDITEQFSAHYSDARGKFLAACLGAGATVTNQKNPAAGPGGEALYTDVARLGPADASRIVMAISGTHGVEGFCGSGVQVGLLENSEAPRLPDGMGLLLVHAINPYGFAWLRRVTEDNVDLNRNFVDHAAPYRADGGYDQLAEALVPRHWDEQAQAAARETIESYGEQHGLLALQAAISVGQYRHPTGLFFGGDAPTWSRRCMEHIARDTLGNARHVAIIDFHTGLGPYGYGEPICMQDPDEEGFARALAWYGEDVTSPKSGSSKSADVKGTLAEGLFDLFPDVNWTGIALEFGTKPLEEMINALRADAWLHNDGDLKSAQGLAIKAEIRAAFYPDEEAWKRKIWARGAEMVGRAYDGLAGLP